MPSAHCPAVRAPVRPRGPARSARKGTRTGSILQGRLSAHPREPGKPPSSDIFRFFLPAAGGLLHLRVRAHYMHTHPAQRQRAQAHTARDTNSSSSGTRACEEKHHAHRGHTQQARAKQEEGEETLTLFDSKRLVLLILLRSHAIFLALFSSLLSISRYRPTTGGFSLRFGGVAGQSPARSHFPPSTDTQTAVQQ